ncbi:MAG: Uma2 family endonuclease [Synechococcales cyanobacterium RU_4_20]|nr:Uma2 family endonuclease [Synechococcales cyanobacterium RU_4_20]NJR70199.1 Uma2 family endonuclease [Synechococcales cyanobacterium CRU_2_2]
MVTLQLRQLIVQPGHRVQFQDVTWTEFEAILTELGDHRPSRLAYAQNILEIRMPLPKPEKAKVILDDIVKILLAELNLDHESFGSSTFKRADMAVGIEPDDCFYIQNAAQMIGKDRVNLAIDPPPDLAIEVDVTSKTGLAAYQALGVPELWRFEDGQLRISVLQAGTYQDRPRSTHFPQFDLIQLAEETLARSQTTGQSQALRVFRSTLRGLLGLA